MIRISFETVNSLWPSDAVSMGKCKTDVQSSALAMEYRLSCINPSIWPWGSWSKLKAHTITWTNVYLYSINVFHPNTLVYHSKYVCPDVQIYSFISIFSHHISFHGNHIKWVFIKIYEENRVFDIHCVFHKLGQTLSPSLADCKIVTQTSYLRNFVQFYLREF